MECPACHDTLRPSYRKGVEIDFCPNCRGVWLDRGELEQLIEASASSPGGRSMHTARESFGGSSASHSRAAADVHDGSVKRRDSWISRLLDFV
jgi:hypothetical protein